jgi:hypothetical protein
MSSEMGRPVSVVGTHEHVCAAEDKPSMDIANSVYNVRYAWEAADIFIGEGTSKKSQVCASVINHLEIRATLS